MSYVFGRRSGAVHSPDFTALDERKARAVTIQFSDSLSIDFMAAGCVFGWRPGAPAPGPGVWHQGHTAAARGHRAPGATAGRPIPSPEPFLGFLPQELFLHRMCGFGREQVHDLADRLGHAASGQFVDALTPRRARPPESC